MIRIGWGGWWWCKNEKIRKRKVEKRKGTGGSTITTGLLCRYRVACMISLLVLACMVHACGFLVICCHWHGDFPGLTVVLTLPFHFLDNHGIGGFPLVVSLIGS